MVHQGYRSAVILFFSFPSLSGCLFLLLDLLVSCVLTPPPPPMDPPCQCPPPSRKKKHPPPPPRSGMLRSNARRYFVAFNHVCQLL